VGLRARPKAGILRPMVWIFPLAAAVVAIVFAVLLFQRFAARRRPYNLMWGIAMLMFAAASLAVFQGVRSDAWSSLDFKVFWLFGALLNVPYLAMGEAYLLIKRRWLTTALLILLIFATAFAFAVVRNATIHVADLARELPRGLQTLGKTTPWRLAQVYSYPTYAYLVAGTIWSAFKMRGNPTLRDQFFGTLFIAIGATIVAGGAAFAATGVAAGFSITLAVGIAVMFLGFLRASRRPAGAQAPPPAATEGASEG
jgi:hypothetical protein